MKEVIILLLLMSPAYLHSQETWQCFTEEDGLIKENPSIVKVLEYDRSLWLLTNKGINVFKEGRWIDYSKKDVLINNPISTSFIDSKNNLWIGTYNVMGGAGYKGGVAVYNGNDWVQYSNRDSMFTGNAVNRIFEDSKGNIWVATASNATFDMALSYKVGGIAQFDGKKWINHSKKQPGGFKKFVTDIFEDKAGNIWFVAANGGVFFYNGKDFEIPSSKGFRLGTEFVHYCDSKGNVWIANEKGISKYDGSKWHYYDPTGMQVILPAGITEIPNGKILVITTGQVFIFDGSDEWEEYRWESRKGGWTASQILKGYTTYFDSHGSLWVYCNRNLAKFDGKNWTQEVKELTSSFFVDSQERIWVPAEDGLEVKVNGEWIKKPEITEVVRIVEDTRGNIWIGTKKNGAVTYNGREWLRYDNNNQLPSSNVKWVFSTSDGKVWIFTDSGVCYYKN